MRTQGHFILNVTMIDNKKPYVIDQHKCNSVPIHRHVRKVDSNLVFSGRKYTCQLSKTIQDHNHNLCDHTSSTDFR